MSKIVLMSDSHNRHNEIDMPSGDILIHCGDFTNNGTEEELNNFYEWFKNLKFEHKILIPGNHDKNFYENSERFKNICHVLNDNLITINGLRIWGSGKSIYTEGFIKGYLQYTANEITEYWNNIPKDLDILITHGPPYGILDKNIFGINAGDQILLSAITAKKPKYHFFGHIHEGVGVLGSGETTCINASVKSTLHPFVFTI